MSLPLWIVVYVVQTLLWVWILFLGGAERLDGTKTAGCLIAPIAMWGREWTADEIKLFGWLAFLGTTFWFILGIVSPMLRFDVSTGP